MASISDRWTHEVDIKAYDTNNEEHTVGFSRRKMAEAAQRIALPYMLSKEQIDELANVIVRLGGETVFGISLFDLSSSMYVFGPYIAGLYAGVPEFFNGIVAKDSTFVDMFVFANPQLIVEGRAKVKHEQIIANTIAGLRRVVAGPFPVAAAVPNMRKHPIGVNTNTRDGAYGTISYCISVHMAVMAKDGVPPQFRVVLITDGRDNTSVVTYARLKALFDFAISMGLDLQFSIIGCDTSKGNDSLWRRTAQEIRMLARVLGDAAYGWIRPQAFDQSAFKEMVKQICDLARRSVVDAVAVRAEGEAQSVQLGLAEPVEVTGLDDVSQQPEADEQFIVEPPAEGGQG